MRIVDLNLHHCILTPYIFINAALDDLCQFHLFLITIYSRTNLFDLS